MLEKNQIEELKNKLQQDKESIEKQLSKFAKKDKQVKDNYRTEFPDIGTQADENAQEITEYEQNISLEHNFEDELKLINNALEKIEKGNYGSCEVCDEKIPYERLRVRPQAVMCVSCKTKKETSL